MYWTRKHVLVCTASHCAQKGANEVIGKLRLEIVRKGLDTEILINNCGTIDLCDIGPNMVVYPDNVIYHGVSTRDLPEIIEHLKGGPVVERLLVSATTVEETRRGSLLKLVNSIDGGVTPEQFEALTLEHGMLVGWLAEQQRRGFVARKPNAQGIEMITVTKKARDRYSLNG